MKINLYTVFVAEHLLNADDIVTECLTCYGKSFTCRGAALTWVRDDILEELNDALADDPALTCEDIDNMAMKLFDSGNEIQWAWENCDRQIMWKLIEDELEIGGLSDNDTVSRYLEHCSEDNVEVTNA